MLVLVPEEQEAGDHTQGPSMYFETGDLSTLEYLYDLRWMRASSEMQSMVSFSACEGGRSAVCSGGGAKCHCDDMRWGKAPWPSRLTQIGAHVASSSCV